MKNKLLTIFFLLVTSQVFAVECKGKVVSEWDNCHGIYNYAGGDKYVGEFKNSKQHGQGTYTFADGNKKVGQWENGKFIGE